MNYFIKLFRTHDELSPRNFRVKNLSLFLIFPAAIIMGDLRYLDQEMSLFGIDSITLILMAYGLGWGVALFVKEQRLMSLLKYMAILSAVLLPFQIFMEVGTTRLWIYLVFHIANGVCVACGFYLFAFVNNNVERFFAIAIAQAYYAFIYTFWDIGHVAGFLKTAGSALVMALLVVVALMPKPTQDSPPQTGESGKGSGAPLVMGIDVMYFLIMHMMMYIEYDETRAISFIYGIGSFVSLALILIIQLKVNKNALTIWNLCLILSVLGTAALLINHAVMINLGSFAYGVGDGMGYVIVFYMLGGALKQSKSYHMYRLCCLITFIEYFVLSAALEYVYAEVDVPNHYLAFAVIFLLVCVCFLIAPALQKKLFDANWTDGYHLMDMSKYKEALAEVEQINVVDRLGLTPREKELFTLLRTDMSPKEIFSELKISRGTYNFHSTNLYRKLGIQSRTELMVKYSE
jgi:DNA-binding CsgD family transcriptional regulator